MRRLQALVVAVVVGCGGARPTAVPPARIPTPDEIHFELQLGHNHLIKSVDLSADGRLAVTADGAVAKVWDLETGLILRTFSTADLPRPAAGARKDVSVEADIIIHRLFDSDGIVEASFIGTGHEVELSGRTTGVRDAISGAVRPTDSDARCASTLAKRSVSMDRSLLACELDGDMHAPTFELVEVATRKVRARIPIASNVSDLQFSRDNKVLAITTKAPYELVLFDTSTGARLRAIPIDAGGGHHLNYSTDGRRILWKLSGWRSEDKAWMVSHELATGAQVKFEIGNADLEVWPVPGDRVVIADDDAVRLFDLATGKLRLTYDTPRAPQPVIGGNQKIGVSRDGKRLGAYQNGELAVFDVASGALLTSHRAPELDGRQTVAFSPDGRRLAIGAGSVEIWDLAALRLEREILPNVPVRALRFAAPDRLGVWVTDRKPVYGQVDVATGSGVGAAIAVGEAHTTWVSVSGRDAYVVNTANQRLKTDSTVEHFDTATGSRVSRYTSPDRIDSFLPEGTRAADTRLFPVALVNASGKRRIELVDVATGKSTRTFAIDDANGVFRTWLAPDERRLVIALSSRDDALEIWDAERGARLHKLPETSTAVALEFVSSDRVLIGTQDGGVTLWDLPTGKRVWSQRRHDNAVADLAVSPDRRYAATVAGSSARLWRLDTGASVALVSSPSGWLAYSDGGYFEASQNGAALVAAVERGRAYRIDQLAVRYNRPDRLLSDMGLGDAETIAHFRAHHDRRLQRAGLDEAHVGAAFSEAPRVGITGMRSSGATVTLTFDLTAVAGLRRYQVWANGVPVLGATGRPVSGPRASRTETIELGEGVNRIEVGATDVRGADSLRAYRRAVLPIAKRGDLYVLAFGVSQYKDARYNLGFAHKDALDLADALRAAPGYTRVHVRTWTDREVTVAALRDAKKHLVEAKVGDTVVVFAAGHGIRARDRASDYYFATHEMNADDLARTAAPFELLEGLVQDIAPRRKLLLLDTCESGDVDPGEQVGAAGDPGVRALRSRALVRVKASAPASPGRGYVRDRDRYIYADLARRSGAIVLSSSRGSESSYELDELRNGVFTEGVLRALTGVDLDADADGDGRLSTTELLASLGREVPPRTRDRQHPVIDRNNPDAGISLPLIPDAAAIVERR